jgi:predicted nucleic acid-binding protein
VNTALDSSVIFAIAKGEPAAQAWMAWLVSARVNGALLVCETVWAETRQIYPSRPAHARAMHDLGLQFSPLLAPAASLAGEIQAAYRRAGGKRDRMLADFLIGAHAVEQADQLATCDGGFLRAYFRGLKIVEVA